MSTTRQTWILVGIGVVVFSLSLTFKLNSRKEHSSERREELATTVQESRPIEESEPSAPSVTSSFTPVEGGAPSEIPDSSSIASRSRSLYGSFASPLPFVTTGEPLMAELIQQIGERNPQAGQKFVVDYTEMLAQPVDSWSSDIENRIANALRGIPDAPYLQASVLCRATGCQIMLGELSKGELPSRALDNARQALAKQDWFYKEVTPTRSLSVSPASSLGVRMRMFSFKKGALQQPSQDPPVSNTAN